MLFFLVAVALLASAHAAPKSKPRFPNGRIVGGENAVIETFPHQISLEAYESHICGGSIISAHYVVTAGHCVETPKHYLTVRAGTSLKGQGGSVHQVVKVTRHEKFYYTTYDVPVFDIALLRVQEPFKFDETRQPISLYEKNEEAAPGVSAVITGWGNTGSGSPIQLQTVSVPIVSKEVCDKAYASYEGLPDGQICAAYYGVGGKDSCQGDSGGPLTINGRLVGIVSWGNGCAAAYYPGVYTEIAAFRDWINKHVKF